MSKIFIAGLRNKLMYDNEIDDIENKIYRQRYSKKMFYFIGVITKLVLRLKNIKLEDKLEIRKYVLKSLLCKNAATYLRQDSIQILMDMTKIKNVC